MNFISPHRRTVTALFCVLFLTSLAVHSAAQSSKRTQAPKARTLKGDGQKHPYKAWLEEDVCWVITDEEKAAFKSLTDNAQRDQFIEAFWVRRDPTPDTPENEFKEEHYRRIAYANEHFASDIPGWKTDRGRLYIMYGPPDKITPHPHGGNEVRPAEEGGGTTYVYPHVEWYYRYLEGIGQDVTVTFVDVCGCEDYHMTLDPSEKDALLHGSSFSESVAYDKTMRSGSIKAFPKTLMDISPQAKVKFKDLEELATHQVSANMVPLTARVDYVRLTTDTILVPVTLQITKSPGGNGAFDVFGRITSLSGLIVQTFEDTIKVDSQDTEKNMFAYGKALPLRAGLYRLDVVVRDKNMDRVGTLRSVIRTPFYEDERLAMSSLILGDEMESAPSKDDSGRHLILANTYIHPLVPSTDGRVTFKKTQQINSWVQVYNLETEQKSHKSSAIIDYDVVNRATNTSVNQFTLTTNEMENPADQITLKKSFPASGLQTGTYELRIKVRDAISGQVTEQKAAFAVE